MAFQNTDEPYHPIILTQIQQGPVEFFANLFLYLLIQTIRMQTGKRCEIPFPSLVRQNKKTSLRFPQKSNQAVIFSNHTHKQSPKKRPCSKGLDLAYSDIAEAVNAFLGMMLKTNGSDLVLGVPDVTA